MSTLFADTSFFVAYLSGRDCFHELAMAYMTESTDRMVTTEWVLAELGNFLAEGKDRRLFGPLIRALHGEQHIEIVKADTVFVHRCYESLCATRRQGMVIYRLHFVPPYEVTEDL